MPGSTSHAVESRPEGGGLDRFRASFVPRGLASLLLASPGGESVVRLPAIALFADLSGFTRANDLLEQRDGPRGAESITQLLASRFRIITGHVAATGGECVELNGDSVLALWCNDAIAIDPRAALRRIEDSVGRILDDFGALAREDDIELGVRIGVAAGEAVGLAVPISPDHFEVITGGAAIHAAIAAQTEAPADGFAVAEGAAEALVAALRDIPQPEPVRAASDRALAAFAPRAIAELTDPSLAVWSNVLLPGMVLFANVGTFVLEQAAERRRLARAVALVIECLGPLGGRLNKVCLDEKGVTILVPFGLPPQAVYVDPDAIADAALELRRTLAAAGVHASIGVASGTMFSGLIGDDGRRAHCVNGRAVNRAARLAACARDRVLCDRATHQRLRPSGRTSHVGNLELKGFAAPIAAFTIEASPARAVGATCSTPGMIGRGRELAAANEILWDGDRGVRCLVVEGPPGIGKSRLLSELVSAAAITGGDVVTASVQPALRSAPFAPWRRILRAVLSEGADALGTPRTSILAEVVARAELPWELAPLLAELVGVDLAENAAVRALHGDARAYVRKRLVVAALRPWMEQGSALLILEDVHWMDFGSWELLAELVRSDLDLAILLSARPSAEPPSPECRAVLEHPRTRRICLGELGLEESRALAAEVLAATDVDVAVAEAVHRASGGNPFYVRELALELDTAGQLARRRGRVVARAHPLVLGSDQTAGVDGVVASRIAQLPPTARRLVQCASVAGMEFDRELLRALDGSSAFEADLRTLVEAQMLEDEEESGRGPNGLLRFRHAIGRDGAYASMADAQRRQLNHVAARWWEAREDARDGDRDALLAHHWFEAGDAARAAVHAGRAGARALMAGAHADAAQLLTRAIECDEGGDSTAALLRRARLLQGRGAARVGAGELARGDADARAALHILGVILPKGKWDWMHVLVREAVHYFVCVLRAGRELASDERERRRIACDAASLVSDVAYFRAEPAALLLANLHAFAQARVLVDDEPVARALGMFGYLAGMARLHGAADRMFRRGLAAARNSGRPRRVSDCLGGIALYHLSFARWQAAYTVLEEAVDACRVGTEPLNLEMGLTLWGLGKCFEGRFAESRELFAETYRLADARGSQQQRAWGLYATAQNLLPLGAYDDAAELLEAAREALQGVDDRHSLLICTALSARCALRSGDVANARVFAGSALAIADGTAPNNVGSLEGYSSLAESWLGLAEIEAAEAGGLTAATRRSERRALRHLERYARLFPIGRPRLALFLGRQAEAAGRFRRARRLYRVGLRRAEALAMRYDHACASLAISRCPGISPGEARDALRLGRRLLAECGAAEAAAWPLALAGGSPAAAGEPVEEYLRV